MMAGRARRCCRRPNESSLIHGRTAARGPPGGADGLLFDPPGEEANPARQHDRHDPIQHGDDQRHRAEPADEDQHGNEGDRPHRDRGDDVAEVADADEMPVAAKQPGPMEQRQPDDEEIWKGLDVAAELVRRGPEVEAQGVREEVGERDEREVTNDGNRAPIATQESKRFHRRCRLVLHLLCSDLTCLAMGRGASTLSALGPRAPRNRAQATGDCGAGGMRRERHRACVARLYMEPKEPSEMSGTNGDNPRIPVLRSPSTDSTSLDSVRLKSLATAPPPPPAEQSDWQRYLSSILRHKWFVLTM